MMNTAVEAAVNLCTEEYHEKAKIAKDVAAGAVVLTALNAVIVSYFYLLTKLFNYLNNG